VWGDSECAGVCVWIVSVQVGMCVDSKCTGVCVLSVCEDSECTGIGGGQ